MARTSNNVKCCVVVDILKTSVIDSNNPVPKLHMAHHDPSHVLIDLVHVDPAGGPAYLDAQPPQRVLLHGDIDDVPLGLAFLRLHLVEPLKEGHGEALVDVVVVGAGGRHGAMEAGVEEVVSVQGRNCPQSFPGQRMRRNFGSHPN